MKEDTTIFNINEDDPDELNHTIKDCISFIAVFSCTENNIGLKHICGYEKEAVDADIEALKKELKTDSEFGMTALDFNLLYFIILTPNEINIIMEGNDLPDSVMEKIKDVCSLYTDA